MSLDRMHYELKLAWKMLVLAPLMLLAPLALFVVAQHFLLQNPAHVLLAAIEMMLPLAAGVLGATTLAQDPMLELHLTAFWPYRATGMLRLLLIVVWIACLALLATGGIGALHLLYLPAFSSSVAPLIRLVLVQLVWLAPLTWMVTVGLCLGLLTRSRTASGALIGGIWLLDIVFAGVITQTGWLHPVLLFPATLVIFPASAVSRADFNTYWLSTRFELLGTALVLLALGWLLLQNTEGLLQGATDE